jgi:hypothetical protein
MRRQATTRTVAVLGLALASAALSGCAIASLVGGMAESARRTGSHQVYTEYDGLKGKSFAVVVAVDRAIESEAPGLSSRLTGRINILISNAHAAMEDGATAAPRVDRLLKLLYNNPSWVAMPRSEVADMLGVERLIVVDVAAYRLHEPGNQYVWAGVAAGTVSVYESDGPLPDDAAFEKAISVSFPDGSGYMVTDMPFEAVNTELSNRFANRVAWLFFDHQEPNEMNY